MHRTLTLTQAFKAALLITTAASVGACNMLTRASEAGGAPQQSPISNPTQVPGYTPVSLPMPPPETAQRQPNSLWRSGSRAFFKDQRAARVGDLITVLVEIADEGKLDNSTSRSRNNTEAAGMPKFLGYETKLGKYLPTEVTPEALVEFNSNNSNAGSGSIDRKEDIKLKIAAIVTQVLPNNNLVIRGSQQVTVNYEMRELQIHGVIRPEDISSVNTISYDKIAEARIVYGGRGQITDVQQPRYGTQIYDIFFPF
ncbi:MAG: flagellar basal body L-ring protein FlgH [Alphaproteobacteria bacterium]|nr:flagellar basal body L-ring protein FlgH [Alphaproteobacteria bacterium]